MRHFYKTSVNEMQFNHLYTEMQTLSKDSEEADTHRVYLVSAVCTAAAVLMVEELLPVKLSVALAAGGD